MPSRVPRFAALCLVATLPAATALAEKKAIAVLGLEVAVDGPRLDEETNQVATELTAGLRKRARASSGPYRLAPNSDKDLLELKLLSNCSSEARDCMVGIGLELSADRLLYGRVTKRSNGYQVSLDLLDTERKEMERATSVLIPFDQAGGPSLDRWGRRLYNLMTGAVAQGTLVVQANTHGGAVYVDGQRRAAIRDGRAHIRGLRDGSYIIAVSAPGYRPYEGSVAVASGETETLQVELEPEAVPAQSAGRSRALFWTTAVTTAVGAGALTVNGVQVRGELKDDQLRAIAELAAQGVMLQPKNACADAQQKLDQGTASQREAMQAVVDACNRGKSRAALQNIMMLATGAAAIAAAFFYYDAYVKPSAARPRPRAGGRRGRQILVAPTLGPTPLGAGVVIEF